MKRTNEPNPQCEVCTEYLQQPACQSCQRPYDIWVCAKCGAGYEDDTNKRG